VSSDIANYSFPFVYLFQIPLFFEYYRALKWIVRRKEMNIYKIMFFALSIKRLSFPLGEYLPERPYSIDGIKAILRKNNDDIPQMQKKKLKNVWR